ncbi:MAG: OsmC family protein [Pseudolabrys sp.]
MSTAPDGKAGGMGLGFNGGQLLGLAIGGCFCNDLHYVAHDMGIRLASIEVDVEVAFEGNPLIAKNATMRVAVMAAESAVSNSIKRGIPVQVIASD